MNDSNPETDKVNELRKKIKTFNTLMLDISSEITSIYLEGRERELSDVFLEMVKALEKAQQTVRHVYKLHEIKNNKKEII